MTYNIQFNSFALKCIAVTTMLIDHIGCIVYRLAQIEHDSTMRAIALVMRNLGRVAFPLFVMLLVEGFFHTRSKWKYALRLFVFAIVSEYPYRQFTTMVQPSASLNIGFTLLLIFLMLMVLDWLHSRLNLSSCKSLILNGATILLFALIARQASVSYGWKAIIIATVLFYVKPAWNRTLATSLVMAIRSGLSYGYLLLLLVMPFYNGERGRSMKYLFYLFYPLHLLALYYVLQWLI